MADHACSAPEGARERFLLQMYSQMWNNINRHILVVWQPVGVVVAAAVLFGFVEKKVISLDVATSAFLVLLAWLLGHVIDAGTWYNRNIQIISNIERQFLRRSDLSEIHHLFGKPPKNDVMEHVKLQGALGIAFGLLVLGYHFFTRVWPGFFLPSSRVEASRILPYTVSVVSGALLVKFLKRMRSQFIEFVEKSPGADIRD